MTGDVGDKLIFNTNAIKALFTGFGDCYTSKYSIGEENVADVRF